MVRAGTVAKSMAERWVVVDIVDDGPGVPEAFIDRIFEPFFTTRDGGTGYGLYLAAELLREQSGRLTVVNNPKGERRSRSGSRRRIPSPERKQLFGFDVSSGRTSGAGTWPPIKTSLN